VREKIFQKGTTWYEQGGSDLMEILEEPRTLQYIQDEVGGIVSLRVTDELIRNAVEIF
jgi:hypothetical protein